MSLMRSFAHFVRSGAETISNLCVCARLLAFFSLQSDSLDPSQRKYRGIFHCASELYAEGGIGRFYRGFAPCALRAIPANGVMLYTVRLCMNSIATIRMHIDRWHRLAESLVHNGY